MTPKEAGALLTYAARIDPRLGTPGREDAYAWAELLDGLDFARCSAAIKRHYRDSDVRIMPSHIRALARSTTDGDAGPVVLSPRVAGLPGAVIEEPHAGEALCPRCALIHRPDTSCEDFARLRRPWPRPISRVVREITDAPASPSDVSRTRALQRARAERGVQAAEAPWQPPEAPPVEEHAERPAEERDYVSDGLAITLEDLPPHGLGPSACAVCRPSGDGRRPVFLDYPAGRTAHEAFGHRPRPVGGSVSVSS
jgi:hypothetical protein